MVRQVGTKAFEEHAPLLLSLTEAVRRVDNFDKDHIHSVVSKIEEWYESDRSELSTCTIRLTTRWVEYMVPTG
jgi:hypothetical protein